jgi:uncharacterized protein (DUF488 family)
MVRWLRAMLNRAGAEHDTMRARKSLAAIDREAAAGRPVVLTVGHSTRSWKEFLGLLRAQGVQRVVDVRTIPRSRHNPQFNREMLAAKLRAAGIGYVHLRKLGGLRHARRDPPGVVSPNAGWRNASFRGYADYMQTEEFATGLARLIKLATQKRSAMMCAEAVPWRCHRSLIADALIARGIRVEDIMSETRAPMHRMTPFARVHKDSLLGKRITYPPVACSPAEDGPAAALAANKSRNRSRAKARSGS